LTNTSDSDVWAPADVLTGIFFDTSYTLTPVSASLNGSTVHYGASTDPGMGWGYGYGVHAHEMNGVISASGAVEGFGFSNFSSDNYQLGGLDYGILSMGDDIATGNTGVVGHGPLFKDSILLSLTVPTGFALDDIGDRVAFQYGTDLSDPWYYGYTNSQPSPVPEPRSILLFASGLGLLIFSLRHRFKLPFFNPRGC
jgi:hypothetical protein